MKVLSTVVILVLLFWSQAASAEFCTRDATGKELSCRYTDTNGRPHNAMMTISYTQQGWSLMVAIFLDEDWKMIEGDGKLRFKDDTVLDLEYATTHRDLTEQGRLMEAAFYMVGEDVLEKIGSSKGSMYFHLPSEQGELELKFWTKRFKEMDDFIAETKATVGLE